jgi:Alpha-L-fucosidase
MQYRLLLVFWCFFTALSAQDKPSQRWLDQKFSMFIHFGLYSVYGGVYEGKPVTRGYSEQIQSFAGIFSDWYADTAKEFNPVKWNPDSIVVLAKEAGMKSVVFTSKHHDGFCMYHSGHTDFNIVDATPYGRDLMKELADACRRGGIDFGVYYSLIDWHYPHGYPISSHNADPLTPEHYAFNLRQVEEIMTNYGSISEIWFDMGSLTPQQSKGLYELVSRLQPQCMISGRLGNDFVDFSVMGDNEYPDYQLTVPWQTAASVFDETWGYRSWQERGELQPKVDEKIASLVKVIGRGGNYLLNIGPRGDGSIVEFERELLREIGKWVKANGEAIYKTEANPFHHTFSWGDVTEKEDALYLFVKKEFEGTDIPFYGFKGVISEIKILETNEKCESFPPKMDGKGYYIRVPKTVGALPYTVLKISFKNGYRIIPENIVKNNPLTPQNATPFFGHSSLNYYSGYKSLIAYDWAFQSRKKEVVPELFFTDNEKGKTIRIEVDGISQEVTLHSSGSKTEKLPTNALKWGDLYRKPGRGVFGFVEEENREAVSQWELDSLWQKAADFNYGEKHSQPLSHRGSLLFLQEIESAKEQYAAVEIGSGNAVYVLLNGKYITAHFSPERVNYEKEIVLLPLVKGKNQLIVKYYNGFEKEFFYSLKPLNEWTVYSQKLLPVKLSGNGVHSLLLRDAGPISKVSPLRMNNIQIKM